MPALTGNSVIDTRNVRISDAARYIGVSAHTLRLMVLRGEIKAIRRPGLRTPWLFDIRELDRWIEAHNVSGILRRR